MKDVFLIGMVGSGKGTQARKIVSQYPEYSYFEMGSILRALKGTDNAFGHYMGDSMDKGELLDDSFVNNFFRAYMVTLQGRPALIDGFPRKLEQSVLLRDLLKTSGRNVLGIWIHIEPDVAIERLSNRKTCPKCFKTYNTKTNPDLHLCQQCNIELIVRADDKPEIILKRIVNYMNETMPVVDFFKKKGLIVEVDGNLPGEEIFNHISSVIT